MTEIMAWDSTSLYGGLAACCLDWRFDRREDELVQASADFVFPAGYAGFAGHFPGRPILPAIVQLAAVRYLAERVAGRELLPSRYEKTKFKGMIGPDERVVVAVGLSAGQGGWAGTFTLSRRGGETAATGRVEFTFEGT